MEKPNKTILSLIRLRSIRNMEIRQATAASPGMEIGAAYKKWKDAQGAPAEMLLSYDIARSKVALQNLTNRLRERPCTRPGCDGLQFLEAVCSGCVEGQAGYKTKWTCKTCMHRDLSKEALDKWLIKLSSA